MTAEKGTDAIMIEIRGITIMRYTDPTDCSGLRNPAQRIRLG